MRIFRKLAELVILCMALATGTTSAQAQQCTLSSGEQARFESEHLFGGRPTSGPILVRRAYVTQYDSVHRVPKWVAWRAAQDIRATLTRQGAWASFRTDPDIVYPVTDDDYDGIYDNGRGYARGHIAPYFISGGDRNSNGRHAVDDIFDACTVYEVNYMSNIAPQLHNRFNGSGGLWYKLETIERQQLMPRGLVLHIIAGTIFGSGPAHIGPSGNVGIPDMFYRILVTDRGVVPFLFVHGRRLGSAGCELDAELESCIVPVKEIEDLTGSDFFSALDEGAEQALEGADGLANWHAILGGN